MAASSLGLEQTSVPFKGFDTGVYTLYIGADHKKLTVPGYILTRIPSINKLIIDKNLIEDEPVFLEAYNPEAFANVLALVRDGFNGFKALDTSQQLIKTYIVAYDLNLESIQNFLMDQIKIFHFTHAVQPQDFELLYAAQLTSDCNIHKLLLHKMAHDFQVGLYRNAGMEGGTSLNTEHAKQMELLRKGDPVQLSHQITILSTKGQCASRQNICDFHEHVVTPRCTTSSIDRQFLPMTSAVTAAESDMNAKERIFRFRIDSSTPAKKAVVNQALRATCVSEGSNSNASDLVDLQEVDTGRVSYTKVAQWLEATGGSKDYMPGPSTLSAEKVQPAKTMTCEGTLKYLSDAKIEFAEESLLKLSTPGACYRAKEGSNIRDNVSSALPTSFTSQQVQISGHAPTDEESKCGKAVPPNSTTGPLFQEALPEQVILDNITRSDSEPLDTPSTSQSPPTSSHLPRPRLMSEVLRFTTNDAHNKNNGCTEESCDGQEASLDSSAQDEAPYESLSFDEDLYSSEEENYEERTSDDIIGNEGNSTRQERPRGINTPRIRTLSDALDIMDKAVKLTKIMSKQGDLRARRESLEQDLGVSAALQADSERKKSQEQMILRQMSDFLTVYNWICRNTGTNPNHAAAAHIMERQVRLRLDGVPRATPSNKAFGFSSVNADAIMGLESTVQGARRSNGSNDNQSMTQELVQRLQDFTEREMDRRVLNEVASEIEGFKRGLGL